MKPTAVLVLGPPGKSDLVDAVFDAGLAPLVRQTIPASLRELRRGRFALILVDRDHSDEDVLEFILNVRDIDEQTPVVVLGRSSDEQDEDVLTACPLTFVLATPGTGERLSAALEPVLMMTEKVKHE